MKKLLSLFLIISLVFTSFSFSLPSFAEEQEMEPTLIEETILEPEKTIASSNEVFMENLNSPVDSSLPTDHFEENENKSNNTINNQEISEEELKYEGYSYINESDIFKSDTITETTEINSTLTTSIDNENAQTLTLNYNIQSPTGSQDFNLFFDKSFVLLDNETNKNYGVGLQGACSDGSFFYLAFVIVEGYGKEAKNIDTRIVCATKNSNGSFSLIKRSDNLMSVLYHAGDMTYNKNTGEVAICTSDEGHHQEIYTISAQKLQSGASANDFKRHNVACMVTSLDYNYIRNQYIVGITANANYFAILDANFNLISTINTTGQKAYDENWSRQGIYCDENYIYALYWYPDDSRSNAEGKNKIRLFKWDGTIVKTFYFSVTADNNTTVEETCESENMFVSNGTIYISFFCRSRPNRAFYYVDLSNIAFHIQYCIDENVTNYPNNHSTNLKNIVIRGNSTPLLTNRHNKSGYLFAGWTAYRKESDSWYCRNSNGDQKWIKTAELNSSTNAGYSKYVYNNNQNVANTGAAGEHVLMCAQWQASNYFYVDYYSNGGSGTMSRTTVTHGTATPLRINTFTKTVSGNARTFQGWNAYWEEQNKWYYKNSFGTTGWYQENCEPNGYVKYVYSDGQTVARTAWKGGHIQMHAVWDEFNIFYDANGAIIQHGSEREMQTAWYKSGNTNVIMGFDSTCFNANSPKTMLEWDGWHLYRREVDMWYYKSPSGSCEWYTEENAPSTWNKYLKEKAHKMYLGGTARPGEHLILVAAWGAA